MSKTPSIPPGNPRHSLVTELDDALGEFEPADLPTFFLVGLSGRMAGKLFKVRGGEQLVGRSSRAFLCLDEKSVSHKHANLTVTAMGCTIEDLGSTNGTFVNDRKLSAAQELHAGDVIRIGNNAFGFLTDAEDEQQHTRAMARITSARLGTGFLEPVTAQAPSISPRSDSHLAHMPLATATPAVMLPTSFVEEQASPLDAALDKLEIAWAFLRKYWMFMGIGLVLGGALGLGVAFIRPIFSVAQFEIYLRQEATPDPARSQRSGDLGIHGGEFFAFAERKFTEPSLIQKTLRDLDRPSSKSIAAATASQLSFSSIDRQGTFRGTYTNQDAKYAELFLAAHLQNFLEAEINKSLTVHVSEVDLMRKEFEKNEQLLSQVEQQLRVFKEQHLKALPEHAVAQIQSRAALLAQRDRLSADVSRFTSELTLAKQQLASERKLTTAKVARAAPYETALAATRQQIASGEAKGYAEGHPELLKLREEERRLDALRLQAINQETTDVDRVANVEHQRLEDRVGELSVLAKSAQQELEQAESRLGEIEALSSKLPGVEAEITRLIRAQAGAKEIHERLNFELKSKELELQFERAGVAARYEVMRPPSSTTPSRSAALIKFGGIGTVGGLFLGIAGGLLHLLVGYARRRKVKVTPGTSITTVG